MKNGIIIFYKMFWIMKFGPIYSQRPRNTMQFSELGTSDRDRYESMRIGGGFCNVYHLQLCDLKVLSDTKNQDTCGST